MLDSTATWKRHHELPAARYCSLLLPDARRIGATYFGDSSGSLMLDGVPPGDRHHELRDLRGFLDARRHGPQGSAPRASRREAQRSPASWCPAHQSPCPRGGGQSASSPSASWTGSRRTGPTMATRLPHVPGDHRLPRHLRDERRQACLRVGLGLACTWTRATWPTHPRSPAQFEAGTGRRGRACISLPSGGFRAA